MAAWPFLRLLPAFLSSLNPALLGSCTHQITSAFTCTHVVATDEREQPGMAAESATSRHACTAQSTCGCLCSEHIHTSNIELQERRICQLSYLLMCQLCHLLTCSLLLPTSGHPSTASQSAVSVLASWHASSSAGLLSAMPIYQGWQMCFACLLPKANRLSVGHTEAVSGSTVTQLLMLCS